MKQIVITGAAGFIGSNLARSLNAKGHNRLVVVDKFNDPLKQQNLAGAVFSEEIDRDNFAEWLESNHQDVSFVFHLGARTDTTEFNFEVLKKLNLDYSKTLWDICTVRHIPLVYASSAATYGMGENGFSDDHALIPQLKPLNPYGLSKQMFDLFVLEQKNTPPFWAGLKFFNVFGPYEFHKGRMASVVLHAWEQISKTGKVKLFKSHRPEYKDGEQMRDFIYIDEVTDICLFLLNRYLEHTAVPSAIYNVGSGKANTFKQLVEPIFSALNLPIQIEYIPIPEDVREKYQYFTEARIERLRAAGYRNAFTTLEAGVLDYVREYLLRDDPYR